MVDKVQWCCGKPGKMPGEFLDSGSSWWEECMRVDRKGCQPSGLFSSGKEGREYGVLYCFSSRSFYMMAIAQYSCLAWEPRMSIEHARPC